MPGAGRDLRRAAGLVLGRTREGREEVYLARRAEKLSFFGGFWAFPGGGVGRLDDEAADLVAGAEEDAAFLAALARETLEELGLWILDDRAPAGRDSLRREVLDDAGRFADWLRGQGRSIDGARPRPLIRLITPEFYPRRFDTRFYRVELPAGQQPSIWPGELDVGGWETPARWLERWRSGEILLAPPVLLMLEILDERGSEKAPAHFEELQQRLDAGWMHPIHFNPAVQLIPLETPTLPPARHTNAYVVGRDPAYLIDPASPHASQRLRLEQEILDAQERGLRLGAVILSHEHVDHVGAAAWVRERFGVPVWAHPVAKELLQDQLTVDCVVEDGDRLPLGVSPVDGEPWELEVLFTPGHARGHLCFFERVYGSLLAGDMISTLSSILVHPDDGDMIAYMASLDRLIELPSRLVFPSHGPPAHPGPRFLRAQRDHRRAREASLLVALQEGVSDVASLVARIYDDVPPSFHRMAAASVRSMLAKLRVEGRVEGDDEQLRPL